MEEGYALELVPLGCVDRACFTGQAVHAGTKHVVDLQILRYFIQSYRERSRSEEQLVQIARLLVLPMVEAGFDANEVIIDKEAMALVVSSMFDPLQELAGAHSVVSLSLPWVMLSHLLALSPLL